VTPKHDLNVNISFTKLVNHLPRRICAKVSESERLHLRRMVSTLAYTSQVFGLNRFRETELIHGRWAMLATLGVVVAEATTGVAWQDAGKVELDGASYLGLGLPFTVTCAACHSLCALDFQPCVR